jgi:hypothetical protein
LRAIFHGVLRPWAMTCGVAVRSYSRIAMPHACIIVSITLAYTALMLLVARLPSPYANGIPLVVPLIAIAAMWLFTPTDEA